MNLDAEPSSAAPCFRLSFDGERKNRLVVHADDRQSYSDYKTARYNARYPDEEDREFAPRLQIQYEVASVRHPIGSHVTIDENEGTLLAVVHEVLGYRLVIDACGNEMPFLELRSALGDRTEVPPGMVMETFPPQILYPVKVAA